MAVLAALLRPSGDLAVKNGEFLVVDSALFFVPSKPHRIFGVTGRFYLERARHSTPRILHLLIKFPQLVNEIQLHIGVQSVGWQVPSTEQLQG